MSIQHAHFMGVLSTMLTRKKPKCTEATRYKLCPEISAAAREAGNNRLPSLGIRKCTKSNLASDVHCEFLPCKTPYVNHKDAISLLFLSLSQYLKPKCGAVLVSRHHGHKAPSSIVSAVHEYHRTFT